MRAIETTCGALVVLRSGQRSGRFVGHALCLLAADSMRGGSRRCTAACPHPSATARRTSWAACSSSLGPCSRTRRSRARSGIRTPQRRRLCAHVGGARLAMRDLGSELVDFDNKAGGGGGQEVGVRRGDGLERRHIGPRCLLTPHFRARSLERTPRCPGASGPWRGRIMWRLESCREVARHTLSAARTVVQILGTQGDACPNPAKSVLGGSSWPKPGRMWRKWSGHRSKSVELEPCAQNWD